MTIPHALALPRGAALEIVQIRHGAPIPEGYQWAAWAPSHHDAHIDGIAVRVIPANQEE